MDFFPTHNDYFNVLSEAQQRAAPVVYPPFVARHLAFWNPVVSKDDTEGARNRRRTKVDEFLHALLKGLDDRTTGKSRTNNVSRFETPNQRSGLTLSDAPIALFAHLSRPEGLQPFPDGKTNPPRPHPNPNDLVAFHFRWCGFPITLRFELHTEYLTLTTFIDMSLIRADDFSEIVPTVEALRRLARAPANAPQTPYTQLHTALYESVWQTFDREILALGEHQRDGLGEVFADFRALVVSRPDKDDAAASLKEPFWRDENRPPSFVDCFAPSTYWEQVRKRFWPLIAVATNLVDFSKREITVTPLLDGRALYASSLGAQPREPREEARFPLFYFLYANCPNGWQLGRLSHHMHHLGTVRLAALMEFRKLRAASEELQGIAKAIKTSARVYHEGVPTVVGDAREKEHLLLQAELAAAIKAIDGRITALHLEFDGDMEHRIARSGYYVDQFRQGLKPLRARRLEGYQPYPDLVERRIGPTFNSINLLAALYERVMKDRGALFQYHLAQMNNCIQAGTRDRNTRLVILQRTAEYGLVLGLLPYYFAHSFIGMGLAEALNNWWEPRGLSVESAEQGIWLTMFYVAAMLAGVRAYFDFQFIRENLGRGMAVAVCVVLIVLLGWALWVAPLSAPVSAPGTP